MDWNQIESKWLQYAERVQQRWIALDADDIAAIAGRREQLSDKLQERYGLSEREAEQQIDDFCARMDVTARDKLARKAA